MRLGRSSAPIMLPNFRIQKARTSQPHDPPSVPDVVSIYDDDAGQAVPNDRFEIVPA